MNLARLRAATLGLLILNVSLGAYLFATRNAPHSSEARERRTHLLPTFRADEVTELQIAPRGQPNLTLINHDAERGIDGFHVGSPAGPHAEDAKLVSYLETLEYARFGRPRQSAPVPTGEPALGLTITANETTTRLVFYAPEAQGGALASRQFGEHEVEWFEVSSSLLESLNRSASDFLPRLLFPLPRSETKTLEIFGESPLKFEARGGTFSLDGLRADRDVMEGIFAELGRAKLDPPMDAAALATPQRKATVVVEQTDRAGEKTRVELGGVCGPNNDRKILAVRVQPEPLAGCVDLGVLSPLERPKAAFIDSKLTPLRPDEIDHVVLRQGTGTYDLIRKDAGFEVRDPTVRSMPSQRAIELIRLIAEPRSELIAAPASGTATLQGSLRIVGHGPNNEVVDETLEFSIPTQGAVSLRRPDGAMLKAEPKLERLLRNPEANFRDTRLFSVEPSRLLSIEHESPLGRYRLLREGESFAIEPGRAPANVASANQLWRSTVELEVVRFLTQDEANSSAQKSTQLRLRLHFAEPQNDRTLDILAKTSDGYRATLSQARDGVAFPPLHFVLSDETVRSLTRLPFSEQSAACDPAPRRAELLFETAAGAPIRLSLERRGTSLVLAEGEASLPADEIWRLVCELSPTEPRPDLRQKLGGAKPVLRVVTESDQGRAAWRFYPNLAAPSWRRPSLIATVEGHSIPFAIDASAFETLLAAAESR